MIADQRHGIAVAALANINRDVKKKPEPFQATDFIYWHPVHRSARRINAKADSERVRQMLRAVVQAKNQVEKAG